jgi:hypothetical protein
VRQNLDEFNDTAHSRLPLGLDNDIQAIRYLVLIARELISMPLFEIRGGEVSIYFNFQTSNTAALRTPTLLLNGILGFTFRPR